MEHDPLDLRSSRTASRSLVPRRATALALSFLVSIGLGTLTQNACALENHEITPGKASLISQIIFDSPIIPARPGALDGGNPIEGLGRPDDPNPSREADYRPHHDQNAPDESDGGDAKTEDSLGRNEAGETKSEFSESRNEAAEAKSESAEARGEAAEAKNESSEAKNESGEAKNESGEANSEIDEARTESAESKHEFAEGQGESKDAYNEGAEARSDTAAERESESAAPSTASHSIRKKLVLSCLF